MGKLVGRYIMKAASKSIEYGFKACILGFCVSAIGAILNFPTDESDIIEVVPEEEEVYY